MSDAGKGSTSALKEVALIYSRQVQCGERNDMCSIPYLSTNGRRKQGAVERCMDFHQCKHTLLSELILPEWSHYSLQYFAFDSCCLIKKDKAEKPVLMMGLPLKH